jgi:hypothetical protein
VEVGCGGGVQLREVTCVQASQGSQPVSPELCESLEPLPTVQRSVPPLCLYISKLGIFTLKNLTDFLPTENLLQQITCYFLLEIITVYF